MKTVGDMLKQKGHDIYSVTTQSTVYDALKLMADKKMGAVLVIDEDKLAGIITERDYARRAISHDDSSKNTPVTDLMTKDMLYVGPEKTVEECMFLMTTKHVRHLPVIENDNLIGIISINDVVKIIVSEQKFALEALEKYMHGSL